MRRFHILSCIAAAVLLTVAAGGCVEPLYPDEVKKDPAARELTVRIYLPAGMTSGTKAAAGSVSADAAENALHEIQVWAYLHRSGATGADQEGPVAYLAERIFSDSELAENYIERTIVIPGHVMEMDASDLKFDFYVLGNASSLGVTFSEPRKVTRGTLKKLTFGKKDNTNRFGDATTTTVPAEGLPMACFYNGEAGGGFDVSFLQYRFTDAQLNFIKMSTSDYDLDDATLHLTQAQKNFLEGLGTFTSWSELWEAFQEKCCPFLIIRRAVAKVRFVFAKAESMEATETRIDKITFGDYSVPEQPEGVIPDSTYVFPRESGNMSLPANTTYSHLEWTGSIPEHETTPAPLLSNDNIGLIDTPLRLRSDSDIASAYDDDAHTCIPNSTTAQLYNQLLSYEVGKGHATEKVLYLRESDKPLQGRIYYHIGEEEKTPASFSMDGLSDTHFYFYRNCSWTVYAYFTSHGLEFQVTAAPWEWIPSSDLETSHL